MECYSRSVSLPEPETETGKRVRDRLSPERWSARVSTAQQRARTVQAVEEEHESAGRSYRKSLAVVAPSVPRSRYQHWCDLVASQPGPAWERLIDRRIPPARERIAEVVGQAAVVLRRADPDMNCETARRHLVAQFGDKGDVSDTVLRRLWSAAGLAQPSGGARTPKATRFDAGGGLALILAAEVETGAAKELAEAALRAGLEAVLTQGDSEIVPEPEGRDERGRLTAEYNRSVRAEVAPGEADGRFDSDGSKRKRRDLSTLATLKNRSETLRFKFLSMGAYGLVSERRGFEGLDGPRGALLGAFGCVAYMPSTISKCLGELGLLEVGSSVWDAHARKWRQISKLWSEPDKPWLQMATYVDASKDPYWTRRFALSGEVSRVGRVMPCLSRVYVHAGPGVPLVVDTFVGTVSLKKQLVPTLQRVEAAIGEGELGRVTIVDAEMATVETLSALAAMPDRLFVTVWKGAGADPEDFQPESEWEPYRQRDSVRDGKVLMRGKGAPPEGKEWRAVEMRRQDSRHPQSTIFLTNDSKKEFSTSQVADLYLSRWPHQEQRFRDGRNGLGMERSHGYGGEYVRNIAIEKALEKSGRRQVAAAVRLDAAKEREAQVSAAKSAAKGTGHEVALSAALKMAQRARKAAEKVLEEATAEHAKNLSTPREIFKRDTARDAVTTAAAMMVQMLIEFVMQEYFPKLKMDFRQFIEHFINAPVTVIDSRGKIIYRIETNPRSPERSDQLRQACAEATRRRLRHDGKLLVFEAVDPGGQ